MKRVSLIVFCLLIVSMASITAQKYASMQYQTM